MAKQTQAEKKLDRQVEESFYKHGNGVQVPMMKISAIFAAGRAALAKGEDLDTVMPQIIQAVRAN